jgi:hypothetical protein
MKPATRDSLQLAVLPFALLAAFSRRRFPKFLD